MSRYLIPASLTATTIAVALGLEMISPGFTIVALFVVAKVATGLVLAAVWPLAAGVIFYIGWRAGRHESIPRPIVHRHYASDGTPKDIS